MRQLVTALTLYFAATSAIAASISQVSVSRDQHTFFAAADFVVDLPRHAVITAFTEIDQLARLNPAIVSSRAEILADGTTRVFTVVNDCIGFFCRAVALVEDFNLDNQYSVQTTMVPGLSDFRNGTTLWQFAELGDKTRVSYRSSFTPDFWIPPLLGSQTIRKSLIKQIRATSNVLEGMNNDE